ncbi:transposase [Kitasatospora sp. GP82]|nr:transposase [Kitasatospora sp. GP82]
MARPSKYSPEFRADAVALWQASVGRRTFKSVASDLNINHETLRTWVREAEGTASSGGGLQGGGAEDELARLRAENARLVRRVAGACRPGCGPGGAGGRAVSRSRR